MRKALQIAYKSIIIGVFIILGINSCTYNTLLNRPVSPYLEFPVGNKYLEETLFFLRCTWHPMDKLIADVDFCILADREIIKQEPLAPKPKDAPEHIAWKGSKWSFEPWEIWKIDEKIKVRSVIFGEIPGREFLIKWRSAGSDQPGRIFYGRSGGLSIGWPVIIPISSTSNVSDTTQILFGYRKGDDYSIEFFYRAGQEFISLQAIKEIKRFESLSTDAFQKERQELLDQSNNSEALGYLFRRSIRSGRTPEVVALIQCLSGKNPSMTNRKFLSYAFSLYTLNESSVTLSKHMGLPSSGGKMLDEWVMADSQKQTLIDIVTGKFSEISSISEGLKYLRLIGMIGRMPTAWSEIEWKELDSPAPIDSPLFKKIPVLKGNLKAVAQTLSKRFANDKDYPEWQKWVNKIFPEQSPK